MVPTFSEGSFFADRYRVEQLLGTGAMGRVYEATELYGEGRRVALKVLHRERMAESETVERFQREAEVLASIGHPCIVKVYAFHHTSDGIPYLAMELLEGLTLKTRLQNGGRFETAESLQEIVDGVCGALSAAHARGVVHRDLKPDNVFLLATGNPRAKLVDFGLSRLQKADKALTHSGMILGTPRYMAPEQIKDASSSGPAGDIYSLGVMVFECLTGQSPYPAEDYGQLLGCVLEGRTRELAELRPDLPPGVGEVIRRALEADPERRFRTCDDLADAYGAAIGVPSRREAIAQTRSEERPARPRKISNPNVLESKGSTLAFDASAAREMLEQMASKAPDSAPPVVPDATADPGRFSFPTAENTEPEAAPYSGPMADYEMAASTAPAAPDPGSSVEAPSPVQPGAPATPPPPQLPAQGGDTMFLPSSGMPPPGGQGAPPHDPSGYGGPAPYASPSYANASNPHGGYPQPYPGSAYPPGPAPASAPTKGRGRVLTIILFLMVLLFVIALSAAAGFALKEYQRRERDASIATTQVTA